MLISPLAETNRKAASHRYALAVAVFLLIAAAAPSVAPRVGQETLEINGRSIPTKAGLGVLTQPISCIGLPVCTVPVWPDEVMLIYGLDYSPAKRSLC